METNVNVPTQSPTTGPQLNALKHGLRSTAILLPGEDELAFRQMRANLFDVYQPRTQDEADCVEGMAACKWRIRRCREMEALYHLKRRAVLTGSPEGHVCEPDPHRWQHRGLDCQLEETRLHRLMSKDRATLLQLQWLRRNRLIDGALEGTTSYLEFLGEEDDTAAETAGAPATASSDGPSGEIRKRTVSPVMARVLRERDARLRRKIAQNGRADIDVAPTPGLLATAASG